MHTATFRHENTHINKDKHTKRGRHTLEHTQTHECTHTHIYTYMYTCVYTHAHTHTHTLTKHWYTVVTLFSLLSNNTAIVSVILRRIWEVVHLL